MAAGPLATTQPSTRRPRSTSRSISDAVESVFSYAPPRDRDLAGLYGEVLDVKQAPIVHETREGRGTLRIGDVVSSEMRPYTSSDGSTITTLRDSIFSTVPGSPA